MITISGYKIKSLIYQSKNSLIYRAKQESKKQPVILKVLRQEYPTLEEIVRYKKEYQILCQLDIENVIKAYQIKKHQNKFILFLEDFGGESLDALLKSISFSIKEFLLIAVQVTKALEGIHSNNIIHKDINPSNIIFNRKNGQVKIIDFGISTFLPRENTTLKNPNILEGTLAYISPEQTGRMNCSLDYRTDFYSLGATFYKLLTGQLPFTQTDVLELIHCHIALEPIPPHQINPNIPKIISDIVMKLMAKNPQDRYQSALGIKLDLEKCLFQLQNHSRIEEFLIGVQDISERLQIGQKLYGREQEIDILLKAFERIRGGKSELTLISGYSGIGKSALVREVYKPVTEAKGYFIAGKFDQYQKDLPYSAIIQAFQELIKYLLTENEATLARWREKILDALGVNAQLIINVISEVELIVGKQPEVASLTPKEAQNRLNLAFVNLIKVFAQPENPLVIFLDDLQWADSASLQLMQLLMTVPDIKYLFLIGAYRNNEVNKIHPLMLVIDEIEKAGIVIERILLSPLDLFQIEYLITDSFNCTKERTKPLAKLILAKTDGNPFFINEFLKSLYRENLLYFDYQSHTWQWNLAAIQEEDITDNVVELLSLTIQQLKTKTQEILQIAACIGNQFELKTLATVAKESLQETSLLLQEATIVNLIYPLSDAYKLIELDITQQKNPLKLEYKFVHDRIQQAAYSLISKQDKSALHRQVGEVLLHCTPPDQIQLRIFDIVNQLNRATKLIENQQDRDKLAKLNLTAGKRALFAGAYDSSYNYLQLGIKLLGKDSWERNYNLTLAIYLEATEAAYLNTCYKEMNQWSNEVLRYAKTPLVQAKVYEVKISFLKAQKKLNEAVKHGAFILNQLGVKLDLKVNILNLILEICKTEINLFGKKLETLSNLSELTDPYKLAALNILQIISSAAYQIFPKLYVLIIFKQINIILEYGNCSFSPNIFAAYGVILCGFNKIDYGYKFGNLALDLSEKGDLNGKKNKALTLYWFYTFLDCWKRKIKEALPEIKKLYCFALENGNFDIAGYSAIYYIYDKFYIGEYLDEIKSDLLIYSESLHKIGQEMDLEFISSLYQTLLNLIDYTIEPQKASILIGTVYNENIARELYQNNNNQTALFLLFLNKLFLSFLFYDYEQAVKNGDLAFEYIESVKGSPSKFSYYFYDSLAKIRFLTSTNQPQKLLKKINNNRKKLKFYAKHSPLNNWQRYTLVEAEFNRVHKNKYKAADLYENSITFACKNEYLNDEALAYELAAKFYLEWDKPIIAQAYMKKAWYLYKLWGAIAKIKHLEEKYPELISENKTRKLETDDINTEDTSRIKSETIDLQTIIKVNKTLSKEKDLEQLLEAITKFTLENIGAETGLIILNENGKNLVKAVGKTDKNKAPIFLSSQDAFNQKYPQSIINYVRRTKEIVVLENASAEPIYSQDDYIFKQKTKSVFCLPLLSQAKFIGVIYLENNLVTNAFNEERSEVLKLISSQAAIAIENALFAIENAILRKKKSYVSGYYKLGGSLKANAPSYVQRDADRELYQNLIEGNYCYILNARQMGKSSLRIRIAKKLRSLEHKCVLVDVSSVPTEQVTREEWYKEFLVQLTNNFLELHTPDFKKWRKNVSISHPNVLGFKYFIEEILLANVKENIVIFLEEIDCIRSLPFSLNDFFSQIRYFYNCRGDRPEFEKISFVFIGATLPTDLIEDPKITPFNIGTRIRLSGFKLEDTEPLIEGFKDQCQAPKIVMKEILDWTGGQPFLTQRLCSLVTLASENVPDGKEKEWIAKLVETEVLTDWQQKDRTGHLNTIQRYILQNDLSPENLLRLYKDILLRKQIIFDSEIREHEELLTIGIVKIEKNILKIFNLIYESVFNLNWVEKYINQAKDTAQREQYFSNQVE